MANGVSCQETKNGDEGAKGNRKVLTNQLGPDPEGGGLAGGQHTPEEEEEEYAEEKE